MSRRFWRLIGYFIYLFVVWSAFRYWLRLPAIIEELWFKPVFWLMPLFWLTLSGRKHAVSKGETKKGLLFGALLGIGYFGLVTFIKGGIGLLSIDKFAVSFATAAVEGLVFWKITVFMLKNELKTNNLAVYLTSILFLLIHLPISIFVYGLSGSALLGYLILNFCFASLTGWVVVKSNSYWAGIVAHFLFLVAV